MPLKRVTIDDNGTFVEALDRYGTDDTFYQIARVCTGKGFHEQTDDDEKRGEFIARLIRQGHLRPFEFAGIVVGIRCPIFVERQLRTYRKPDMERSLRMCEPIEKIEGVRIQSHYDYERVNAINRYKKEIENGAKREEARRILTLDTLTEVASYYTIRSLFHVFDERLHPAAQSETRRYVTALLEIARELFPQTIKAYEESRDDTNRTGTLQG